MNQPILRAGCFFLAMIFSATISGQSYNVNIVSLNNYSTPGDSIEIEINVTSGFTTGNYFQFGLAPLGIQSTSQIVPCATASLTAYSTTGTYTNYIVPGALTPYGSYIVLSQSNSPAIIDTVGYITLGPTLVPQRFKSPLLRLRIIVLENE